MRTCTPPPSPSGSSPTAVLASGSYEHGRPTCPAPPVKRRATAVQPGVPMIFAPITDFPRKDGQ